MRLDSGAVLSDLSLSVLVALALAAVSFLVGVVTPNQLVRRKLRLSAALAVLFPIVQLGLSYVTIAPDIADVARSLANLGLALAAISFAVTVAANSLRHNRPPTAVPNILQDALIVGLFLLVGTLLMHEKFLTTSAIGAVVVGLALQDTLGNAFAGLAIQVEKPFRVGDWIRVGEHEGRVEEVTWRATKLRTKATNFVIVPNNAIAKEAIVNYSEPVVPTRLDVEVGAGYDAAPESVKSALDEAMRNARLVLRTPAPVVLLHEFGASAIVYHARFWIADYAHDDEARDQVRTNIYYSFKRHGLEIPYPIQVEYHRVAQEGRPASRDAEFAALLSRSTLFASLDESERMACAALGEERLYTTGEAILREGEPGGWMFVIASGEAQVSVGDTPLGRLGPGDFVGEMSLLTGEQRTATVTALQPCRLIEIRSEAFRRYVLSEPGVFETMEPAVLKRRAELLAARELATEHVDEPAPRFIERVRHFLGLA
jgi:small-conductance mechanosensitive channel